MKIKQKPDVRLPSFNEDWEEYKADSIFYSVSDKNYPELPVLSASQEKGMVFRKDIGIDIQYDKNSTKTYKRVIPGQFVIHLRSFQGGFAFSDIEGITSPAYTVLDFKNKDSHDSLFWKSILTSKNFIKRLETVTYGIRDGRSISFNDFSTLKFKVPNYSEQLEISNFFKTIDNLLFYRQQELNTLKQTKQGFLHKMFPKEGESVPEFRLPDFVAEWGKNQIGEIATIVRGASPRPIQDPKWFDKESKVGWLRISDVTKQDGRIHYLEQRISMAGQEKTRVLKEPHLLLSIAATVGKPVINYVETGVHDGFLIFLNPKFDIEFMFQWLEMFRPRWNKYGQPGSQVNLNSELVKSHEIYLPSIEEQVQIGNFFKQLDELIALQQQELDALKQTKKAFLQKMFV